MSIRRTFGFRTRSPLLRPSEAARLLGWSVSTLARKRSNGDGPSFIRLSARRVAYSVADIEAYLEQRLQK